MIVDGGGDINKLSEVIGDNNVERLKASLETLQKQDYIHYVVDKTITKKV